MYFVTCAIYNYIMKCCAVVNQGLMICLKLFFCLVLFNVTAFDKFTDFTLLLLLTGDEFYLIQKADFHFY